MNAADKTDAMNVTISLLPFAVDLFSALLLWKPSASPGPDRVNSYVGFGCTGLGAFSFFGAGAGMFEKFALVPGNKNREPSEEDESAAAFFFFGAFSFFGFSAFGLDGVVEFIISDQLIGESSMAAFGFGAAGAGAGVGAGFGAGAGVGFGAETAGAAAFTFGAGFSAFTFFAGASFLGFAAGNAGADFTAGCSTNFAVSVPSNRDFTFAVCPFDAYMASKSKPAESAAFATPLIEEPSVAIVAVTNAAFFILFESVLDLSSSEEALHATFVFCFFRVVLIG